jgi:dTDP-glucose 4,6-dehydratase
VGVLLSVGQPGEAYNLGAATERTDLEICHGILDILRVRGDIKGGTVHYVRGRPGHDRRYAMRWNKLEALGWAPQACFEDEFVTTVVWNVEHQDWWETEVVSGAQLAGVHETQRRCG